MADLAALQSSVNDLKTAADANAARVNQKLTDLQNALAAAQAASATIPDDLVAAIQAVTADLNATAT